MPYMIIRSTVENYERWKEVFDEGAPVRRSAGSKGGRLFQNSDDPNHLIVLLEWDRLDDAREFSQSQTLRDAMERAGVIGRPEVYFVNEVESFRA